MKKKLLIYRWGSLNEPLLCRAVKDLGWEYVEFAKEMKHYHADADFAKEFIEILHRDGIEAVFSYDYFPLISMLCEINKIPYISWIYDCPQYTLLSKTVTSEYNYIFCFDRAYAERLKNSGAVHCYHYPLAGTGDMLCHANDAGMAGKYVCDISFVGNLYNDEKNRFRQAEWTPYAAGFLEALIRAQLPVYGINFIKASLSEPVVREIIDKCRYSLGAEYMMDERQMAADMVGMEISSREREQVLNKISESHKLRLYTSSKLPQSLRKDSVQVMGYADYQKEVPLIFRYSKINLNLTSKTIESGIPQRVFDILSCKGFCLTNYQPEIAEYFADGEELVMYTGMEDLLEKVDYYLTHEEERSRIAEKGHERVIREFSLKERLTQMMEVL